MVPHFRLKWLNFRSRGTAFQHDILFCWILFGGWARKISNLTDFFGVFNVSRTQEILRALVRTEDVERYSPSTEVVFV